jgi:glycosyltransferase involved in cell wall biosynthesis
MKVCLVSRSTPLHHRGGMEWVAWSLAYELRHMGHEVVLLTTSLPGAASVPDLPFELSFVASPPGRYSAAWWSATRDLQRSGYFDRFDIVMGIGGGAHALVENRETKLGPVVVLQSHGTPWSEIESKLKVRTARSLLGIAKNVLLLGRDWRLRRYDEIVAIGPAVRRSLTSWPMRWLVGRTPVATVFNGIDVTAYEFDPAARQEVRASLEIDADAPVAISVGRLTRQKGVLQAVRALASALEVDSRWHYVIVGDGPDRSAAEGLVVTLGLRGRVHFVGVGQPEVVTGYLSAGDVFLFPTLRQEGLALAPLEAAANGLVTVTSKHAAIDGVPSTVADPRSAVDIARAMSAAFAQRPAARTSLLPEDYTLARSAEQYVSLFRELIARRARASR